MKTRWAAALSALVFALAACTLFARAQGVTVKAPPEADARNWKEYAPPLEGFSVLAPGVPRKQTQQTPLGDGQTTALHIHMLSTPSAEYGVIYADYPFTVSGPEMAKRILDSGARGAVASVNAELLHESEITLAGRPGRALKERLPGGKIMRVRIYLDGSRLYQIAVTTPDERDAPAASVKFHEDAAAKFLDSFKLTGTRPGESPAAPPASTGPQAEGEVDRLLKELEAKDDPAYGLCADLEQCRPVPGAERMVFELGEVVNKPEPPYPAIAKAARARGAVPVRLIADEEGKVIAANFVLR